MVRCLIGTSLQSWHFWRQIIHFLQTKFQIYLKKKFVSSSFGWQFALFSFWYCSKNWLKTWFSSRNRCHNSVKLNGEPLSWDFKSNVVQSDSVSWKETVFFIWYQERVVWDYHVIWIGNFEQHALGSGLKDGTI